MRYKQIWGSVLWVAALTVLSIAIAPRLAAQNVTSSLTGTVTDPTGGVVPKANVVLTNEATADVRRTVTNGDGFFSFSAILPGSYAISIEQEGFNKWETHEIVLNAGDRRNLANIILKVGATKETVVVEGTASQITPVDSGEKSAVISSKLISNVAILGQNAAEFIKIMPGMAMTGGVVNQATYSASDERTGNGPVQNFAPNGLRAAAMDITSDGAHIVDPGCNCGQAMNTNADMTAEVKVLTSNFGAESSKGPVVINAVGKSGSQQFHGEAYVYARNYAMNANNWLNNAAGLNPAGQMISPRPPTRYWYPGGQIGGPIYIPGKNFNRNKDKLFFFFAAQYYKQNVDNGVYRAVVPTQAMRNGDFSDVDYIKSLNGSGVNTGLNASKYPNGIIPQTDIPSTGKGLMNIYPLSNANPVANAGYNYVNNQTRYSNMLQIRPRVDYAINDSTKLYVSYNRQRDDAQESLDTLWTGNAQSWASPTVPYPSPIVEKTVSDSVSANLTKVFSPTLTNELVFTYTYLYLPNSFADPTKVQRGNLGINYQTLFQHDNADKLIIPQMTGWGNGIANILNGGFELNGTVYAKKTMPTVSDTVSKVWGTHTAKFGFYWERTFNEQPGNGTVNGQAIFATWGGNSTGNVYGDVLTANANSYNETNFDTVPAFRYMTAEFWGQDSWKVSRRLTVEYGMRVSHLGPWSDITGYGFAIWDPSKYSDAAADKLKLTGLLWHGKDSSVPLSGAPSRMFFYNPRVGFAWDIFGNAKTVLRGGYGMYHYHDEQNVQNGAYSITQGSYNYNITDNVNFSQVKNYAASFTPGGVSALDNKDDQQPRTQNYSLTVSQRMPWKSVLEVAYVGNKADYLSNYNNSVNRQNMLPIGALFKATGTWSNSYSNIDSYRQMHNYQYIQIINHTMYSNYNSMQISWNKQAGHLTVMANYTFGKAMGIRAENGIGTTTDPTNMKNLYGTLPNNRTHIFNAAYIYELPSLVKNNAVAKGIANGWQISGITQFQSGSDLQASVATALNLSGYVPIGTTFLGTTVTSDNQNNFQLGNQDILGTNDVTLMPRVICDPRKGLKEHQYWNPACFAAPTTPGQNGDYIFPTLTGPWFVNSDLTLFKKFTWGKEQNRNVELRFSGYNFLNHPVTTYTANNEPGMRLSFGPDGKLNNPTAGYALSKTGNRVMQIALKIMF